jgi:hypothetical protein
MAFDERMPWKAAKFIAPSQNRDARSGRQAPRRTEHHVRVLVHRNRTRHSECFSAGAVRSTSAELPDGLRIVFQLDHDDLEASP